MERSLGRLQQKSECGAELDLSDYIRVFCHIRLNLDLYTTDRHPFIYRQDSTAPRLYDMSPLKFSGYCIRAFK